MGEIADMMLDGTLCEQCGEFLGAETGHPTLCAYCAETASDNDGWTDEDFDLGEYD